MSHACHELHGQHETIPLVSKVLMHRVWYSYVAKPVSRTPCQRLTQHPLQHRLVINQQVKFQVDSDNSLSVSHQRMGFTPVASPRQKGQGGGFLSWRHKLEQQATHS